MTVSSKRIARDKAHDILNPSLGSIVSCPQVANHPIVLDNHMMKSIANKDKPKVSNNGGELSITQETTENILRDVRAGYLPIDISRKYNVKESTVYSWRNNSLCKEWQRAEMLHQLDQVEQFSKELMSMKTGKKDTALIAIKQKESEFLRKQLLIAKDKYNDAPQIAIQVNLPQPIVDLGHLESEKPL